MVLVATRNPLNIGAAARALSNFGLSRLRVVTPYAAAFRTARSAVGASELLAHTEEYKTVEEAVADCTLVVGTTAVGPRNLQHPVKSLPQATPLIRKGLRSGSVALLFGSEKRGLSNHDFSYCNWLMRIPTREAHRSMNLGQAVAVCLYELIRDEKTGKAEKQEVITAAESERITTLLLDVLKMSGYLDLRKIASSEEKIRRLVRRMKLLRGDAESWMGMLRQVLWKMRAGEKSR